jgi:hypothetical protein
MSLVNTMMQNLRVNGNLDKYEYRSSRYGALDLFMRQNNDPNAILTAENRMRFWESIGRTYQIPVFDYDGDVAITVGAARSLTVDDDENTTQLVTITPVTYSFGFTMYPTEYHNNEIGYAADYNKKMIKYINKLGNVLDSACVTKLNTDRTQIIANPIDYTFSSNTLNATAQQRAHLIGALDPIMQSNDFYDQLYVLGDMGLYDHLNKLAQNGLYNATNQQLEYANKILMFTNRITAGSGKAFKGYAVNAGTCGIMFRVDREALYNTKSRTGREWGTSVIPMLNVPCGTMYYESDVDGHSIGGAATADMTATHKQHFGFSVDVALVTSYCSNAATLARPIIEFTADSGDASQYVIVKNTTTEPVNTHAVS